MRFIISLEFLLVLISSVAYGQKRQGYVDFEKVMVTFPEYNVGQKEVEKKTKQLNDSLKIFSNNLSLFRFDDYPRDSTERKKIENKLYELQFKIENFQRSAEGELKRMQETLNAKLKDILLRELEKFSVDNNLICVADKKSILYCNECRNFTEGFIDYCKRKNR